jgi:diaminopimelate epimerase
VIEFSKYHGLGNDFVVIDLRTADERVANLVQDQAVVRLLCDRRFGVGGDGVLALLPPRTSGALTRMRVLNADGGEAEMCGNGLRCVAKHLFERAPEPIGTHITVDTGAGALLCEVTARLGTVESVRVDMGGPRLTRAEIPMTGPRAERCLEEPLVLGGAALRLTAVSMGNPHAVAFVEETGAGLRALAEKVGPGVERHSWFPQRTNAEFAHLTRSGEIELVVWERGCGITLACGTGACATAVAACLTGKARPGNSIRVRLLGGELTIEVASDFSSVFMSGPATHVFDGELDPADLLPAAYS